ncbi:hypothetical protein B0H13DRAFT_2356439 [Mycena leptocephala]|nr:hypothetical protein B0H13DRAFT_2356439 [Mycena leptocephala]
MPLLPEIPTYAFHGHSLTFTHIYKTARLSTITAFPGSRFKHQFLSRPLQPAFPRLYPFLRSLFSISSVRAAPPQIHIQASFLFVFGLVLLRVLLGSGSRTFTHLSTLHCIALTTLVLFSLWHSDIKYMLFCPVDDDFP